MLVLVKAAPVLTSHLDETMCVAGVELVDGEAPRWVRLHPVPFRDLEDDNRFAKYQAMEVDVFRSKSDRRPESWSPRHGTISLGAKLGTGSGWALRRALIDQLPERAMCDLIEENRSGSGPGVTSLAVVRPVRPPELLITPRDPEQIAEWERRAAGASARTSLFDDPTVEKPPFEVVPWKFRYRYHCASDRCENGHEQGLVDWEAYALWRHVRHHSDWQARMRQKFEDQMWHGRDTVLFVGNQEQYPGSFLVLGVFWPPAGPVQGSLSI